ncbi:MAG: rRNA maturation RNase YbeY [candidate division WOR-3 bacterium]|jgi:probable rRNA maturation factor
MIEIIGSVKIKGYKKALKQFLKNILKLERKKHPKKIYILLTNDQKMRKLNKQFLKKDKTTDVISFNFGKIAEIYVNTDYAKRLGDFSYFIAFYCLHGLLHILGYDHKTKEERKEMFKKQEKYINLWKF